jgi:hypothetical protein
MRDLHARRRPRTRPAGRDLGRAKLHRFFAATARDWLQASDRAIRWLNRNLAAAFAALAGRLALEPA